MSKQKKKKEAPSAPTATENKTYVVENGVVTCGGEPVSERVAAIIKRKSEDRSKKGGK